jgi:predicted transposase/invertase (TIGR01784 family)
MKPNKQFKDSVFTKLFGHDKKAILELYNAIFNTNYGEDTNIQITTLEDALFMDRINDISFIIDGKLVVLIEHQSTINNNMPLRMLIYMARIYEKICDKESIYRTKRMKIPVPEFVVLYNGKDKMPDRMEMKVSEMFAKREENLTNNLTNLELVVKVYNINKGHNIEFAQRSLTLNNYETFVAEIHENEKVLELEEAIIKAVKDCEKNGILKNFLRKHSSEVINMLFEEFDINVAKKVWLEEGMEDGIEVGIKKGREAGKEEEREQIARNMKAMGVNENVIAEATGLSVEDISKLQFKT